MPGGINPEGEQIAVKAARGILGRCPPSGERAKDKKTAGPTGGFVDQNIGKPNPGAPAKPARLSVRTPGKYDRRRREALARFRSLRHRQDERVTGGRHRSVEIIARHALAA